MKKKLVMLLGVMAVLTLVFASCGGSGGGSSSSEDLADSKYVGVWEMKEMALGDETSEDVQERSYKLTLNADGTGTFAGVNDEGEEEVSDITWSLTSDGFKTDGGAKMTFTEDGDNIKSKILGVDLIFAKTS